MHQSPTATAYTWEGSEVTQPLPDWSTRRWSRMEGPARRLVYVDGPDGLPIGIRYEDAMRPPDPPTCAGSR